MTKDEDINEDLLEDSALCLDFLMQAGITERLLPQDVTDVIINRPGEIWTESSTGWKREDAPHLTFDFCMKLANSLCAYDNKYLSIQSPIKTVSLPNQERAQIVIPPACERGTVSITIRKPSLQRFSLNDYIESGRMDNVKAISNSKKTLEEWQHEMVKAHKIKDWGAFFNSAIQNKQNIILFGGPGSGKTTFAKSLVDIFPTDRRMVTIDEISELSLPNHPNRVHLLYGDIVGPKELAASSQRMRPDHLFLAELTGDEAWHFIEILNTGKPGTVTTSHANDSLSGYARVAGLIKQSEVGKTLPYDYIDRIVKTSFDVVVYMENKELLEVHYEPQFKLDLLNGSVRT